MNVRQGKPPRQNGEAGGRDIPRARRRRVWFSFTFKGPYPHLAADGVWMARASLDELHLRKRKTFGSATEGGGGKGSKDSSEEGNTSVEAFILKDA